jgi:PEP-CTERM motif
MRPVRLLLLTFIFALTFVTTSLADSLQIGPGVGTDPVVLSSNTSFTVLNNPGASSKDIGTLYLFFSVPTNLVGSFSVAGSSPSLTLVETLSGILTSSGCGDVYSCVGSSISALGDVSGLNNSNSFGNYTGAATANGLTAPTAYTILAYSDGAIAHKQTLTISGVYLPAGTYITAAGVQAGGGSGFTAFTNAGLVVTSTAPVPEPATLSLMGSGLLGLWYKRRRKLAGRNRSASKS